MQETRHGITIRQEICSAETIEELDRIMDYRLTELTEEDRQTVLVRRKYLSTGDIKCINRHERRANAKITRMNRKA